MAKLLPFFLLAFLLLQFTSSSSSPSPSPQPDSDSPSPSESPQISLPPSPSGAPASSPNAAASPLAPPSSESPSPPPETASDAPVPEPASDVSHSDISAGGEAKTASSDGGMSVGKKAGIGLGVIVGVVLVGLGGFVYKRRQDNIRRSQYGYAARREML
ncbi:hypothetical protein ACLB2K_026735 [Fragaria x ananassa]